VFSGHRWQTQIYPHVSGIIRANDGSRMARFFT
jgi:hypothetical protein